MKILVIDVNAKYINPAVELVSRLVDSSSDSEKKVLHYGIGYLDRSVLSKGLAEFLTQEKFDPDVLVIGQNFPLFHELKDLQTGYTQFLKNFNYCYFNKNILGDGAISQFVSDAKDFIYRFTKPVFVLQFNFDYYAATADLIDKVLRINDFYLVTRGEQFILPLREVVGDKEKHYLAKADRLSDDWLTFIKSIPERVVSLVHFAGPHEYCFLPLSERRYDCVVPGVEYALRRQAKQILAASQFTSPPQGYAKAFALLNKLKLQPYSKYIGLEMYNALYRQSIINSRVAYVAREAFGLPVRKFFEVPALGTVMIGVMCNSYRALGFQDRVNFLHCEPEQLKDLLGDLLSDQTAAQRLADNGRNLIRVHHSFSVRSRQLEECIHSVLEKKFAGSYWENGQFKIKKVNRNRPVGLD
jgi:hypothetical protein